MSGFFARIVGWFVQDIVVKQLANSRTFQRLAVKIDSTLTKVILLVLVLIILILILILLQQNKSIIEDNVKKSATFIKDGKLQDATSSVTSKINDTIRDKAGFDLHKFITTVKSEIEKDLKNKANNSK